jgi:uncharacterized protein (DUF362 family)
MDRRQFIKRSIQAAVATAATGSLPVLELVPPAMAAQSVARPELAVRKGKDVLALVNETVAALGGMSRFVKPGEVVVVKPNIGWDREVDLAANTHPEVVKGLAQLCLEAGAAKVRVFDRTCNDPRRCYVNSGIRSALESLGSDRVSLEHIDRRAFQDIAIKGGVALDEWSFYKPAIEADRYINVPVAKHHSISKLTLAMKNTMGVIGGNRGALHRNIEDSLADINSVIHSDLTIVDATRILIANGPQGGREKDVRRPDTLIASADIVAADSYAATLFDHRPEDIPTIVTAARRGLGTMDLKQVKMV